MRQIFLTVLLVSLFLPLHVDSANVREQSLLSAIHIGNVTILRQLLTDDRVLSEQLDPVCGPRELCKPIVEAARIGSIEMVALLLKAGANIEGSGGFSRDTALIVATHKKNFEMAKFMVEHGADVNQPNYFGATPFWP